MVNGKALSLASTTLAIQAQGANSNDQELKDLMKQFIAVMAQDKIAEKSVEKSVEKTEEKFDEEPEGFVE